MSAELNFQTNLTYRKNNAVITRQVSSVGDAAGNAAIQNIVSVGTADETLDKADITNIGTCYFKNLDAVNYIDIGPDGTVYPIRLKAGCDARLPWNGTAVHAKANTAACLLDYVLIEA
jgi:hypothetical protein